jgi:hypothetical protein
MRINASFAAVSIGVLFAFGSGVAGARPVPYEAVFGNPCTGELVFLQGAVNIVEPNHFNIHATGTSASGVRYVLNQPSSGRFDDDGQGADGFIATGPLHFIAIGESTSGDDYVQSFVFRITIDANGEVRVELVHFDSRCV